MKTSTMGFLSIVLGVAMGVFAAPPVPTLISPALGDSGVPRSVSLTWNASPGAATYRLQLSTDSNFATTLLDDSTRTDTSVSIVFLTNNTVYYWRVNAKDGTGTSAFTAIWHFKTIIAAPAVPNLTSPANNAVNVPVSTSLTWSPAARAATYRVQLSTDSTFATTLVDDSTVTASPRAVGPLAYSTVYYWRVNAKNAGGTSAYSTRRTFTTTPPAPSAPTLNSPAPNATGAPVSTSLTWNASAGAATYRVQLSTDSTFATTAVNDSTVTATTRAVGPLANSTVYYWRVNAKNAGGTSAYSTTRSFTTIIAVPSAPTLTYPAQNAIIYSASVTLTWSASPTAITYHVQVAYDTGFTSLKLDDSTLTATSRLLSGPDYNTPYYWRVSAKNAGGNGAYSAVSTFTLSTTAILPGEFSLQGLNLDNGQSLRFNLPHSAFVLIRVFDSKGSVVADLLNERRAAGSYVLPLASANLHGSWYILDFKADGFHKTMKIRP